MAKPTQRRAAPSRAPAPWSIAVSLVIAACGGDDGPEPIPDDDPLARRGQAGRRATPQAPSEPQDRAAAERSPFASYDKVDDALRRELVDRDFRVDPRGSLNRDPFRSYVITQDGLLTGASGEEAGDRAEVCDESNSVAVDYSLRDLTLIGIVLRGTVSYAMFRDRSGLGYIVHRGECLGSEQAVVRSIGSGFVQLETAPQVAPGSATATTRQREILLYPEEYDLPEEERE